MQKAWQARLSVDFGQKSSVQDGRAGGGRCDGLRLRGVFGAIRAGGLLPVEAAGG